MPFQADGGEGGGCLGRLSHARCSLMGGRERLGSSVMIYDRSHAVLNKSATKSLEAALLGELVLSASFWNDPHTHEPCPTAGGQLDGAVCKPRLSVLTARLLVLSLLNIWSELQHGG